jgi:hypothetical protein
MAEGDEDPPVHPGMFILLLKPKNSDDRIARAKKVYESYADYLDQQVEIDGLDKTMAVSRYPVLTHRNTTFSLILSSLRIR